MTPQDHLQTEGAKTSLTVNVSSLICDTIMYFVGHIYDYRIVRAIENPLIYNVCNKIK